MVMGFRILGRTGLKVSVIGIGTMGIGRKEWGVKPADQRRLPAKREVHSFLSQAVDMGVNFVDTAPAYGASETILGEIFREDPALRQKLFLASKCGSQYDPRTQMDTKDFSKEGIEKSIEESLRRLGSPIDLMQLHSATLEAVREGTALEAMKEFQRKGDIKFIGVTCSREADVLERAIENGGYDTIQTAYNLLAPQLGEEVFPLAAENGVGVIANRPLASGLLTSSFAYATEEEKDRVRQLLTGRVGGRDLSGEALNFVLANKYVSTVLFGTTKIERVRAFLEKGKEFDWG